MDDATRIPGGTECSRGPFSEPIAQFSFDTWWTGVHLEIANAATATAGPTDAAEQLVDTCRGYTTGGATTAGRPTDAA